MRVITIFATLFLLAIFSRTARAAEVKEADLAGTWYPANKTELSQMLEGYMKAAPVEKSDSSVFAIISPHAGFQFSGPIAACGYNAVKDKGIKTVVVIGFSHRKAFNGISVYSKGSWRTPLGEVAIDEALATEIMSKDLRMRFEKRLFDEENSVEMQIPFVQIALKGAKIVPIAFGTQDYKDAEILASALSSALKDRNDVLIVASTDLSHFHPYKEANAIDKDIVEIVAKMKAKDVYDNAVLGRCELCGMMPVTAVVLAAEKSGFDGIKILKYANSGDTSGAKDSVVGYLSAVIYREGSPKTGSAAVLSNAQRKRLLQIARESITSFVKDGKRKKFTETDPLLTANMGAFVTLHELGELRGCIGNMVGQGPLYRTVADMAIEAATGDPRFRTLSPAEIERIEIEISVLTPMKKVSGYKDVKIPGDGVLVRRGYSSGVFLPQVATENNWDRDTFLTYLCEHKAALSPDAWKDPRTEIYTFTAEVFNEKGVGANER